MLLLMSSVALTLFVVISGITIFCPLFCVLFPPLYSSPRQHGSFLGHQAICISVQFWLHSLHVIQEIFFSVLVE